MEPANNIHHHHQAEQQLVGCLSSSSSSSSSSLPIPSPSPSPSPSSPNRYGGVSSTTTTTSSRSSNHAWTPSPYPLSLGNAAGVVCHESWNGGILNARQRNHENLLYPNTSSMIQEHAGGLQWISSQLSAHHDHFSRMKEDHFSSTSSPDSLRNFTEMLNVNSDLTTTSYLVTNDQQHDGDDHLMILRNTDKQLPLKSSTNGNHAQFSPSGVADHMYSPSGIFASANNAMPPMSITGTRSGSFSQIYPSINISNLCSTSNRSSTTGQSSSSPSSATNSSNFEMMKLQALDLLLSPSFSQPSHDHIVNVANGVPFGNYIAHLQQSGARLPLCSPGNKMSNLVSNITNSKEITEAAKRRCSSGFMEPKLKATTVQHSQSASKKSKLESSRASFPPFKVRKEKLGDRIAALQQLVAPFGKTDTASVLMEAIGYIKFLQNQVETLSVPYMKAARKKSSRAMHGGSVAEDGEDEEPKQALRSRGLCLVPLSFMSYLIDDPSGGGGIWSTPDFDGGT